jgi:hypothetical protein
MRMDGIRQKTHYVRVPPTRVLRLAPIVRTLPSCNDIMLCDLRQRTGGHPEQLNITLGSFVLPPP